ncbi:MAG TPA: PepSY domain-containing protein [Thermoanaerobaculia bacterium]|jgi:uncharacterized membrane protein YkoI
MKSRIAASIVVATLGLAPFALAAGTTKTVKKTTVVESQADLQKEAKITMEKAREIALTKVKGGKIESGEIERENGKLIYSFDIKTSKPGITEVNVNAMTGKIVDVHTENAAKEAAEKKQEAKEKASAKQ